VERANPPIIDAALGLAWSHWTGLGVRGSVAAPDCAVDPEALIYLTAALADLDPRLWDEASGWWRQFSQHVAATRMTRLAVRFDAKTKARFDALSDAAAGAGVPRASKARLDDLEHPARSLLRLRCAFGTNARAEIVLGLLTDWADLKDGVTTLTLSEVGYGKRNVAVVVQDLAMAGIVVATPDANRTRYRIARPDVLRSLLAPIPRGGGRWYLRMPLIARFVQLAERLRGKDPLVQAVEARKLLTDQESEVVALGIALPRLSTAETFWDEVQQWVIDALIRLPGRDARALDGQLSGSWLGPHDEARPHASPTGAVLPPRGVDVARARELTCLDLVQVSTIDPPGDWTWVVLSEAAVDVYQHTTGLARGERWRFVTTVGGVDRTYVARLAPALPHAALVRDYGRDAADRARRDRPAVRLVLSLE